MNDPIGTMGWIDLTVEDANSVCDFYAHVVGWSTEPVPMDNGNYHDYTMLSSAGQAVAGVCHARGPNTELPAQWLPYFRVANLEESVAHCRSLGGTIVAKPRSMGPDMRYAVIRDPAGAFAALFEHSKAA